MRSLALALAAAGLLLVSTPSLPAVAKEPAPPCVSMNYTDADLKLVLKRLAAKMGYNLYVHPSVQGKVTLAVNDIPAERAFGLVLKMQTDDYGYKRVGNTIVVAPPDKLAEIPATLIR